MNDTRWRSFKTWAPRVVLVLLIVLWSYDAVIEQVPLLRAILALTVIAGIGLLVMITQVPPGLQRAVLANVAGFVVFAGNVAFIALKSQGPLGAVIVAVAAILVLVPWAVRFATGISRLTAEQQAPAPPAEQSGEAAAPVQPPETVNRRERPRYTLPGARRQRKPPASG